MCAYQVPVDDWRTGALTNLFLVAEVGAESSQWEREAQPESYEVKQGEDGDGATAVLPPQHAVESDGHTEHRTAQQT